jgi:UDP-N-acetylmuramate dehydrogenase
VQVLREWKLSSLTTLGVGGIADRVVVVTDAAELVAAVRAADEAGTPLLVLGGGSNVVAPDAGWPGDVVAVRNRGIERDGATLTVQAGEPWDDVVAYTVGNQLAGIEALSGIPGTTGATPIQNVGAYGQEVAQTITAVRVWDRAEKSERTLTPEDCVFGYRDSRLKREPGRFVVLDVTFALHPGEGSPPRWPTCAPRSSSCAAGRGWCSTPMTPTVAARDRSSPTRSSRPTGPSTAVPAGRPATGT